MARLPTRAEAERLAHAVIMPGFGGTTVPPWLERALRAGLGGVCYFGHNIESPEQVAQLSAAVHELGDAVVAVDEEGGIVTRLHVADGSPHVGNAVLGRVDDIEITRHVATDIGRELRRAGVDIDLAPVVDVNANPRNPVIGVRAFGSEPDLVARHGVAFVQGLQEVGVAACPKHFPGHGDTDVDSHSGLPVVSVDLPQLRQRELEPFAAAVDAGARCVMTAHIVFPELDDAPATLSRTVLSLLRDELGFEGVICSDALDMQAISGPIGLGEGAVRALAAGVDLVGLGNPVLGKPGGRHDEDEFSAALAPVVAALESGRLPVARVEEAAARVRDLAAWARAARARPAPAGPSAPEGASADSVTIATRALRLRGEVAGALHGPARIVDLRRARNIASGRLSGLVADALMSRLPGSTVEAAFASAAAEGRVTDADLVGNGCGNRGGFSAPNPTTIANEEREAGPNLGPADVAIVGTPGRDGQEEAALHALLDRSPDAIVVCVGWSSHADDLPRARRAVFSFGDAQPSAEAVADLLTGQP